MNTKERPENLPAHVGLITDGNRRWAKEHGLPAFEGHRRGFEAGKKIAQAAYDRGIKEFTAWAFSTENWDRSKEEVDYLMKLFEAWLSEFLSQFKDKNVRIRVVGQPWRVPQSLQKTIEKVERETAGHSGMVFNLALSYGGRDEITQAVKKIVGKGLEPKDITEETVSENLWLPDVDLIIRTGGDLRLSGFLPWQSVYAELFFVKKYLPDFTPKDFDAVLEEYAKRQRRFGK
jgi:undecaprenyl diphosphate synthase